SGEGKVMGLAPYGQPTYYDFFKKLVTLHPDGSYSLNLDFFDFHLGLPWINKKITDALGPARVPESPMEKKYEDIAASLQKITEDVGLHLARHLAEKTKLENACFGGGVCLNAVMNGKILYERLFKEYFFQPMANDAGCSLGAASYIYHCILGKPRCFQMDHVFWGTDYTDAEIEAELKAWSDLRYERAQDPAKAAAELLSREKIIGWFQGRMEVGPRALGSRSILADPRKEEMKNILNARVKHREGFRPFAPSILAEKCGEYFDCDYPSPYMILVYNVRKEKFSLLPATIHVDGTGRVQTVEEKVAPLYYRLIKHFESLTGVPVMLNTSFNIRGEPIVNTPREAVVC
ncbi:MAG: carbamoyl transferase, partial [Planctomycetes bacterium]|nr:carbamoyl transferase [Planctomycetota bacterium]